MNSSRPFLDNMFNQYLPSVYKTDNSMLNSNLFVIFNAYSEVFEDILRNISETRNNIYIETASQTGLETNFGLAIDLAKPPKLNTITNGGEIYRAIIKTIYAYLLQGATVNTIDGAISLCLSILETDPGTTPYESITNYSEFSIFDNSVQLTLPAVAVDTGTQIILGPATPSQIFFFPPDLTAYDYNASTKTVAFSGTAQTGVNYKIEYFADAANLTGTNWMNLTNRQSQNVSPMNLKGGLVNTYYNPEFSYWWGQYNFSGNGVVVDEFKITANESSLVWRLPAKSIQYVSPYTNNVLDASYQFYNESGLAYDINFVSESNPDALFEDNPVNYQNQVSANITKNYFVRYSVNNNGPNIALFPYSGSFFKYQKKYNSITFPSPNFGQLDFFEKGSSFTQNDLFGYGTKNIWLNVPNVNGNYIINNTNLYTRPFSLHERVLFEENFESGQIDRVVTNFASGVSTSELVGTPTYDKNDCLMVASSGVILGSGAIFISGVQVSSILSTYGYLSGTDIITPYGTLDTTNGTRSTIVYSSGDATTTWVYPLATGSTSVTINNGTFTGTTISGQVYDLTNRVELDFFDPINSGTNTYIDITRTGSSNYFKFRFGFETGNSIIFSGNQGFDFTNTKSYEFVETYFQDNSSMLYATVPGGEWVLVSGNPVTSLSNQSLGSTGTTTLGFNVDNGTIADSDYIAIEYSDSLIPAGIGNGPSITLSTLKKLTVNSADEWVNDTASFFMTNSTSTSFTIARNEQVLAGLVLTTNNYATQLPIDASIWDPNTAGTGPHKLEIIRNSGIFIDGVQVDYSTLLWGNWASDNLASFWANGNLGGDASVLSSEAYSTSSPSISSPLSVKVSFPSNVTLHHVVFGNQSLRDGAMSFNASTQTVFTGNFVTPYFYQLFNSPSEVNPPKYYLNNIPRNSLWSTLTCYFGVGYSGMDCWIDEAKIFSSGLSFPTHLAGPSGLTMLQTSRLPRNEFSYFDNIKLSYYDNTALLPSYSGLVQTPNDWEGSAIDFNAVLDNRYLSLEPSPNFQFSVNIKGISEQYIPIIDGIVDKIKPAHTIAIPIFLFEQNLDTTDQLPPPASDPETDWESGNTQKNVQILDYSPSQPAGDVGLITPSGLI